MCTWGEVLLRACNNRTFLLGRVCTFWDRAYEGFFHPYYQENRPLRLALRDQQDVFEELPGMLWIQRNLMNLTLGRLQRELSRLCEPVEDVHWIGYHRRMQTTCHRDYSLARKLGMFDRTPRA